MAAGLGKRRLSFESGNTLLAYADSPATAEIAFWAVGPDSGNLYSNGKTLQKSGLFEW
jgi:hypothetical protein